MATLLDPLALDAIPLFHGLTAAEHRRLRDLLGVTTFPAGASVLTAEQPGDIAFVVLAGTLKVQIDREDGTAVILTILRPGAVAGEMSLVDRLGRSATVVAIEDSTLVWLTRAAFWECLRTMPTMTYNLAAIHSRRLRLANGHVVALASLDVDGRLAHQLLVLGEEYGVAAADGTCRIPFRLTQGDLAALVGASRVRVNQILVAWKREGYLAVDRQHVVTILAPAALARHCA